MQEKLVILMKENNITQQFMANHIGITSKQFACKLKGETKFNGDEMFKIADYFNRKIEDIFLPTTHQNGELYRNG